MTHTAQGEPRLREDAPGSPGMVCDFEGSSYRADFWESADRRYEDLVERLALRQLLPPGGRRLLEMGAGFGRLADLYTGYDQIVLLDWSTSLLREAGQRLGWDGRYTLVACDLNRTPFPDGHFDALVMVRVLHYLPDLLPALAEVRRLLAPGGALILEMANKRHLKAVLRRLLLRRGPSPWDRQTAEVNPGHFNFHPGTLSDTLQAAGFRIERRLAVSHFRHPTLKRQLPPGLLARLELLLQAPASRLALSPSLFFRAGAVRPPAIPLPPGGPGAAWLCPACRQPLERRGTGHRCPACGLRWPRQGGIHLFKPDAASPPRQRKQGRTARRRTQGS